MLKRKNQVISKVMATTILAITFASSFVVEANADTREVTSSKIAGDDRYKTAVEISKNYTSISNHAVIVNGQKGIVDALTATPYASLKNAPILMTQNNKLNPDTKAELIRKEIKTVDIIGGTASVSDSVKAEIEAMGITVKRIAGNSKYETALKVAKEIDNISDITNIAVANGDVLADAVSVAAPAAENKMPIILAHPKHGLDEETKKFINEESISTSYVIGGASSVSNPTQDLLPGTKKRLEGAGRQDTNAAVIKEFYPEEYIGNLYITKSGQVNKADEIADALAVGVLAAKRNNPVMIVGKSLSCTQKTLLENKIFYVATEIGNGIPEDSINDIKETQGFSKTVKTIEELNCAMANAEDGDSLYIDMWGTQSSDINIETTKEINVTIHSVGNNHLYINIPNGNLRIDRGHVKEKIIIDGIKKFEADTRSGKITHLVINPSAKNANIILNGPGYIDTLEVLATGVNISKGYINYLEIGSSAKNGNIVLGNGASVDTFNVLAEGVSISGNGNIDILNYQVDTDISNFTGRIGNMIPASLSLNIEPHSDIIYASANRYKITIKEEAGLQENDKIFKDISLSTENFKLFTTDGKEMDIEPYVEFIEGNPKEILLILPYGQVEFTGDVVLKIEGLEVQSGKISKYTEETIDVYDNKAPVLQKGEFITVKDKDTIDNPITGYEIKLTFDEDVYVDAPKDNSDVSLFMYDVEVMSGSTKYNGYKVVDDTRMVWDSAEYEANGNTVTISIPKDGINDIQNWNEVFGSGLLISFEIKNPMMLVRDTDSVEYQLADNIPAQEGIKVHL